MLEIHRRPDDVFRGQTVATTTASLTRHPPAGDVTGRRSQASVTGVGHGRRSRASVSWAVYAESEVCRDLQLEARFLALHSQLRNAAGAFFDPGLQQGRFTREQARCLLLNHVGLSAKEAGLRSRWTMPLAWAATRVSATCSAPSRGAGVPSRGWARDRCSWHYRKRRRWRTVPALTVDFACPGCCETQAISRIGRVRGGGSSRPSVSKLWMTSSTTS